MVTTAVHERGSPAFWRDWNEMVHPHNDRQRLAVSNNSSTKLTPADAVHKRTQAASTKPRTQIFAGLSDSSVLAQLQAELDEFVANADSPNHSSTSRIPGARFSTACRDQQSQPVSGGGQYDVTSADSLVRRSAPRCTFGTAARTMPIKTASPDAATASTSAAYREHVIGDVLFSRAATRFPDVKPELISPGPGDYEWTASRTRSTTFSTLRSNCETAEP